MELKLRKTSHVHFVEQPKCPVCESTLIAPIVECYYGHLICQGCLSCERLCPVCGGDYPKEEIIDKIRERPPLSFSSVHGSLIQISNEGARATATGSDVSLGCLAYAFFDQPFQPNQKVSMRVSMGGKQSVYLIAGFSNEDPKSCRNLAGLFHGSSSVHIRHAKKKMTTINLSLEENGKVLAEINGKKVFSSESLDGKSVNIFEPVWGYIRLFDKNDFVEIFS